MLFHCRTRLSEVHGAPAVDLADASLVRAAARGGARGAKVTLSRSTRDWRGVSVKWKGFSVNTSLLWKIKVHPECI